VEEVLAAPSYRRQCEVDNLRIWGLPGETLNRYLDRSSCINTVAGIRVPTLFVCALDDPVSHALFIPYDRVAENPDVVLCTTEQGGHHAYLDANPGALPWCDRAALEWLTQALKLHAARGVVRSSHSRVG